MDDSLINALSNVNDEEEDSYDDEAQHLLNGGVIQSKRFLEQLYTYYEAGGWHALLLRQSFDSLNWLLQVVFAYFVLFVFHWFDVLQCVEDCGDLASYMSFKINIFSFGYIIVCGFFLIRLFYRNIMVLRKMGRIHTFCKNLGFDTSISIANLRWDEFTDKLNIPLTSREIASRLMQYDNFMIALLNNHHIPTRIWGIPVFNSMSEIVFKHCVFNVESFTWHTTGKLVNRFRKIGILYLVLLPVILPLMLFYYISKNIDCFYIQRNILGPRTYHRETIWFLREYNELPHFLKRRLQSSEAKANEYFDKFQDKTMDRVGNTLRIVSGLVLFFLVAISILDDSLLLEFTILNKSLLWHLAVWSSLSAFARSLLITSNDIPNLNQILLDWSEYSHYLPDDWYEEPSSTTIRDSFSRFFPYRIVKLWYDVLGCILLPYFLIIKWPQKSDTIINFIQENSEYVENFGHVCRMAAFDLETYGNPLYGPCNGRSNGYSQQGKLEKSILTFGKNYKDENEKVVHLFPQSLDKNNNINMKIYLERLLQEYP